MQDDPFPTPTGYATLHLTDYGDHLDYTIEVDGGGQVSGSIPKEDEQYEQFKNLGDGSRILYKINPIE